MTSLSNEEVELTIYKVQSTLALAISLCDEVVKYVAIPSNW